jgi:hypothetical protein
MSIPDDVCTILDSWWWTERPSETCRVFLISNFRHDLCVVCFLLGNSPASEFYMPKFRNTLFHLHRQVGLEWLNLGIVRVSIREKISLCYFRAKPPPVWISQQFSNLVILHQPAYEDGTECSETSAYKIQTPGNYLEENTHRVEFCS